MADEKKRGGLFGSIESHEDAIKVARDCGMGFWIVAGLQAALSFVLGFSSLIDAAIYAICGYFIRSKFSRVAAVVVLLLAGAALVATVMNKMGQSVGGGSNIFLAFIVAWAAIRSVEATFKLHGRFRDPDATSDD